MDLHFDPWSIRAVKFILCDRPFRFYNLIDSCTSSPATALALHHICNLIRLRNTFVEEYSILHPFLIIEPPLSDEAQPKYMQEETEELNRFFGPGISSKILPLCFCFHSNQYLCDIKDVDAGKFQGWCLIKRLYKNASPKRDYITEAVICVSPRILPNRFIKSYARFTRTISEREFAVVSSYFSQANGYTSVCAHAAIINAVRNLDPELHISVPKVNNLFGMSPKQEDFREGPGLDTIVRALGSLGFLPKPETFKETMDSDPETTPRKSRDIREETLSKDYRGSVYTSIESACPVILGFDTGKTDRRPIYHAVTVVGHTLDYDNWLPEAEFAYRGQTAPAHYSTYQWVTNWIVMDPNIGMYLALNALKPLQATTEVRFYEEEGDSKRDIQKPHKCRLLKPLFLKIIEKMILSIPKRQTRKSVSGADDAAAMPDRRWLSLTGTVAVYKKAIPATFVVAKAEDISIRTVRAAVNHVLKDGRLDQSTEETWIKRFERALGSTPIDRPSRLCPGPVLRTLQVSKSEYIKHCRAAEDWNYETLNHFELPIVLEEYISEELLWITEFSLTDLYTANQRKIAEVLYSAAWVIDLSEKSLFIVRLPGFISFPVAGRSCLIPTLSHIPLISTEG